MRFTAIPSVKRTSSCKSNGDWGYDSPTSLLIGGTKMKHRVFLAFGIIVLVSAFPLLAQMPKGGMVPGDHSPNAADPDAPGDAKLMVMGSGLHIISPQAGIYWTPADTA